MLQLYEEDTRLELALQPLGIARMRWDGMVFANLLRCASTALTARGDVENGTNNRSVAQPRTHHLRVEGCDQFDHDSFATLSIAAAPNRDASMHVLMRILALATLVWGDHDHRRSSAYPPRPPRVYARSTLTGAAAYVERQRAPD